MMQAKCSHCGHIQTLPMMHPEIPKYCQWCSLTGTMEEYPKYTIGIDPYDKDKKSNGSLGR